MKGIIIKGIGGFYYVKTSDGEIHECRARGVFRKEGITPAIGDRTEIQIFKNGKGNITEIEPRSSYMKRPPVANIDTLLIVAAAASPDPSLFLLDKMIINAEICAITPALCINKSELADTKRLREIYESAGYRVFEVSVYENSGIEELKKYIGGRCTAFAGLSGVGKSSLLNLITGGSMETGAVSEKISRGRHTTRHVELIPLEGGGYVLDTPGFSSLEITGVKAEDLGKYFPEIRANAVCRFRGCSHLSEPDCGVRDALERGEIAKERFESYKALYEQLKNVKEWQLQDRQ